MIHQGIPQRFIKVYRNFLQFRQPEQNAAENYGCGFHGFLPFQQGFIFRFLFFILPGQICVLLSVCFFRQIGGSVHQDAASHHSGESFQVTLGLFNAFSLAAKAVWNGSEEVLKWPFVIQAPAGSYAETYAKENKIPFVVE